MKASYLGVSVEILVKMENYSLVRYNCREFVVETQDLVEVLATNA